MTRRKLLWAALVAVPLAVTGGLVYAGTQKASGGYVCPATGETLPCPDCCPLNAPVGAAPDGDRTKADDEGYVCPLTGETLNCPGCCPLNQKK